MPSLNEKLPTRMDFKSCWAHSLGSKYYSWQEQPYYAWFFSVGPHVPTHMTDHNYMLSHTRPTYSKKLLRSF